MTTACLTACVFVHARGRTRHSGPTLVFMVPALPWPRVSTMLRLLKVMRTSRLSYGLTVHMVVRSKHVILCACPTSCVLRQFPQDTCCRARVTLVSFSSDLRAMSSRNSVRVPVIISEAPTYICSPWWPLSCGTLKLQDVGFISPVFLATCACSASAEYSDAHVLGH